MKRVLLIVLSIFSFTLNSSAQCPYLVGLLADAESTGTPTGEGKNEFFAFNTGGSSIAVNTLYFSYAISTTTTNFAIDGTTAAPSVWTTLATPSLITNSIGTITVVSSGSIPANKNVVVIPSTNAVSYDLKTFGTDVYVLPYNATAGSPRVVGYAAAGNFANSGGTLRYLRIRQGASCRDTASYLPSSLPGADGGGVKWTAAKVTTYINSGSSGAILPINLLSFGAKSNLESITLNWSTSGNSSSLYFDLEKSTGGIDYSKIARLPAQSNQTVAVKEYSYSDASISNGDHFYRLRMVDADGSAYYSPTSKINISKVLSPSTCFPNPVSNEIFVLNQSDFKTAYIMDFYGRVLLEKTLNSGKNAIDFSTFAPGIYMLQLKSDQHIENHKIVKE